MWPSIRLDRIAVSKALDQVFIRNGRIGRHRKRLSQKIVHLQDLPVQCRVRSPVPISLRFVQELLEAAQRSGAVHRGAGEVEMALTGSVRTQHGDPDGR